eukprot:ANDGO_06357.mRNA.1 Pre-mRNA-processing factor 39
MSSEEELWNRVRSEPQNFAAWASLLEFYASQDAFAVADRYRQAFVEFFGEFPLSYGYWKVHADFESQIGGWQAGLAVFERAVSANPHQIEIWLYFVGFLQQHSEQINKTTGSDTAARDRIRSVFADAIKNVGLQFISSPVWDSAIAFEASQQDYEGAIRLLKQASSSVLPDVEKYWESLKQYVEARSVVECMGGSHALEQFYAAHGHLEDAQTKTVVLQLCEEPHRLAVEEVARRRKFEGGVRRSFFHPQPLDSHEIANWHKYLDWEEMHGSEDRAKSLYGRCLIPCATYSDFWQRYVGYLESKGRVEEAREANGRALRTFFKLRPPFYHFVCDFEEAQGNPEHSKALYEHVIKYFSPVHVATVVRCAYFYRRQADEASSRQVFTDALSRTADDRDTFSRISFEFGRFAAEILRDLGLVRWVFHQALPRSPNPRLLAAAYAKYEEQLSGDAYALYEDLIAGRLSASVDLPFSRKDRAFLCQAYISLLLKDNQLQKLRPVQLLLDRLTTELHAQEVPSASPAAPEQQRVARPDIAVPTSVGTPEQEAIMRQWQLYWSQNPEAYQQYVQQYYAQYGQQPPQS